MFKLIQLDKDAFNQHFLRFRIKYYFSETKEFLARHKLLSVFIICLLMPGVEHIQALGIPFYALIDPSKTLKEKLIYLVSLLVFLLAMTVTQLTFIKGGEFREYLHTLCISSRAYKKIDFIILLVSLNIVWLAIFFGAINILHYSKELWFVSSQYCLYAATILAIITLLWNCLYRNIANGILLFSVLVFVVWSSTQASWFVNYSVSCFVILLSGLIIWTVQPSVVKRNYLFKTTSIHTLNAHKRQSIFLLQLVVLRERKRAFITKLILCFAVSGLILQILSPQEALESREAIVLVLVSLQIYILSTLFILFEKRKLDYALFHRVFPYQRQINFVKELAIISLLLFVILVPVFLFCIFSFKNYLLLLLVMWVMGSIGLIINRIFYAQSLRFCLFSSLLSTLGSGVVQYLVLGACFGA
ncbi:MAG: hypothetical protein P4L79_14945 [Legionella sp.]|uniref:DUF6136 family protein n=1 Tax=Legionella sp. TaxID=459 RepID=UPI002850D19C|nr:hypothetical protein [Legionella sp.]